MERSLGSKRVVGLRQGLAVGCKPTCLPRSGARKVTVTSTVRRVTSMQALPNNGKGKGKGNKKVATSKAVMDTTTDVDFSDEKIEKTKRQMMQELETPPAGFSGLMGKALVLKKEDYPTVAEINAAIPAHCKVLDTTKSMLYFAMSTGICLVSGLLANAFIPKTLAFLPVWIAYAIFNGTCGFGFWLQGHECGHFAFSKNLALQDACGYFSHTLCLTPYFSWQRSHAVHHSRVNHMWEGESHVPKVTGDEYGQAMRAFREKVGVWAHGLWSATVVSLGFVLYLLFGASGGPEYGLTNHFWPRVPFKTKLFPKKWHVKVVASGLGVIGVIGMLAYWAKCTSFWTVAAVYGGPYLVLNAWLGIVTLLHHTDTDVPHLEGEEWNYVRGAFLTIDRPYDKLAWGFVDWVQHHIGSTHVLHHLNPRVPHYHAQEATEAIKKAFPDLYLYDPTPIPKAIWRIVSNCISVKKVNRDDLGEVWVYDDPSMNAQASEGGEYLEKSRWRSA